MELYVESGAGKQITILFVSSPVESAVFGFSNV